MSLRTLVGTFLGRQVVPAITLWNTVHYQGALDELRAEGYPVDARILAHLSPTRYAHVNPYGRYRFDLDGARATKNRVCRALTRAPVE